MLKEGTKVKILNQGTNSDNFHRFDLGEVVTAKNVFVGEWQQFFSKEGSTQFLLPDHYQVVEQPLVEEDSPVKAIYAVIDGNSKVRASTSDRDHARLVKAGLGGKRKGFKIFQYAPVKEIR